MLKISKNGLSLIEMIVACTVITIIMIATIDLMSSTFLAENNINENINAIQTRLDITEKISSEIREGSYIYPDSTSLTIPTKDSSTSVTIGNQSLAILAPKFNTDSSIYQPSLNITGFKGVSFSFIPENTWSNTTTDKYALIETNCDFNLAVDPEDNLKITAAYPTDWSSCSSYELGTGFTPAAFTSMSTKAFDIDGNIVTFALVPADKTIYFPSNLSSFTVDDKAYLTSIVINNVKETINEN